MRISELTLRELTGSFAYPEPFWEERLIRPIDIYPQHKATPATTTTGTPQLRDGRYYLSSVFVQIDTDEGVFGLAGPITHDVAFFVDYQFRRLLIGEDPIAIEKLWDIMFRDAVHGRKGTAMMAISAIDCALWDLKGRWLDQPVHRLLGGPVREEFPAYASMLGYSLEPTLAAERAAAIAGEGFTAMKWFPRHGPADGRQGIARNVELMATLREAVGPDVEIMLDAWMSWDVPYTVAIAERLAEFRPRWIEEPVMPDKIEQCAEIHRRSVVPTATGEHEYSRWGLKALLDANAADLLQPDTYWAGGISEIVKISALASAYDVPIIPHGHSVPANVQLAAVMPITLYPMIEFLVKWNEIHQHFFINPVKPVNGTVRLPSGPGMGVELDPAKIESERTLRWDMSTPTRAS